MRTISCSPSPSPSRKPVLEAEDCRLRFPRSSCQAGGTFTCCSHQEARSIWRTSKFGPSLAGASLPPRVFAQEFVLNTEAQPLRIMVWSLLVPVRVGSAARTVESFFRRIFCRTTGSSKQASRFNLADLAHSPVKLTLRPFADPQKPSLVVFRQES